DRHNHSFALGPTHEEVITDLARNEVSSYKMLPVLFYQIQTKFRDEIRPRFGVMRSREFCMKDAYSFHADEYSLEKTYKNMYEAYSTIFKRCGLSFRAVEADTGAIGGAASHEFMVLADSGEDSVVFCENCGYGANMEKAVSKNILSANEDSLLDMEKVHTPGIKTIENLTDFFKISGDKFIKTLIYSTDQGKVAVLIRGDYDVNEIKLKNYLKCDFIELADEETVKLITGAQSGFAGPVGMKDIKIIADFSIKNKKNMISGANETDYHLKNVNIERNFRINEFADVRILRSSGELCNICEHELKVCKGIEVGHIFKLGKKYSNAMKAVFLDEKGEQKVFIMGCYGIGVSRTVAAAIEQNNDENGIVWPMPIAPFQVIIIPTNMEDAKIKSTSLDIYQSLISDGIEVLLDDRSERPGVKFKDADLIGIPLRITLGKNFLQNNKVEIKKRQSGEMINCEAAEAVIMIKDIINKELKLTDS
ncbi:proline--tRNA ligase, partial [Candidatus Desantisbacteria bacterium]|nr:proline--tRNA ligase [Candidatus Desantisbacteria bacterium]